MLARLLQFVIESDDSSMRQREPLVLERTTGRNTRVRLWRAEDETTTQTLTSNARTAMLEQTCRITGCDQKHWNIKLEKFEKCVVFIKFSIFGVRNNNNSSNRACFRHVLDI